MQDPIVPQIGATVAPLSPVSTAMNTAQTSGNDPYDFNKMLLAGLDLRDIQKFSIENKAPIVYGDMDKAITAAGQDEYYLQFPKEKEKLLEASKQSWYLYNTGENLAAFTKKRNIPNTAEGQFFAKQYGLQDNLLPNEMSVDYIDDMGPEDFYHVNGKTALNSPDVIASQAGYFKTNEANGGYLLPMSEAKFYNNLKRVDGDITKGENLYSWQEADDYEVVSTDRIKSIFGDRTLNTPYYMSSLGKGIVGGFIGKTLSGLGEVINAAGDVFKPILKPMAGNILESQGYDLEDLRYNPKYKGDKVLNSLGLRDDETGFYDVIGSKLTNYGNRFQHRNKDEEGTYDSVNSFIYGLGDGIGQIGSMLIGGGSAFLAAKSITGLAKFAPKIATQASLILGASQAGAGFREEMRGLGIPDSESAAWFFPFMGATYLSERMIGPNILTNFWGNGLKIAGKEAAQTAGLEIIENTTSKSAKKYFAQNTLKSIMKSGDKLRAIANKSMAGGAVIAGGEEVFEEWAEDFMDYGIQFAYNGFAKNRAEDIKEEYSGVTYTVNPDNRSYTKTFNDGSTKNITTEQYNAEQEEIAYAAKIDSGEALMKPELDLVGDTMVFWSAGLSGMFSKNLHNKKTEDQNKLIELANDIVTGKTNIDTIYKEFDGLYERNELGERKDIDAEGNTIVYGDSKVSKADAKLSLIKQELQYWIDTINKYGINSTRALSGAKGNSGVITAAIRQMGEKDQLLKRQAELDTKQTLTPEETAEKNAIPKSIEEIDKSIEYKVTPKNMLSPDDKAYNPNGQKSQAFTDEFNKVGVFNYILKEGSREDLQKHWDFKYGKGKYTQQQFDEAVNITIAKRINEHGTELIGSAYNNFISNLNDHTSFTEQYLANKNQDVAELKSKTVSNINDAESKLNETLTKLTNATVAERDGIVNASIPNFFTSVEIKSQLSDMLKHLNSGKVTLTDTQEVMTAFNKYSDTYEKVKALMSDPTAFDMLLPDSSTVTDIDLISKARQTLINNGNTNPTPEQIDIVANKLSNFKELTVADLTKDDRNAIIASMLEGVRMEQSGIQIGDQFDVFVEKSLGYANNTEAEMDNIPLFLRTLEIYKQALASFKNYIEVNYNHFQNDIEKKNYTKEHSPLLKKENERISEDEYNKAKELIKEYEDKFKILDDVATVQKANSEQFHHGYKTHLQYNEVLLYDMVQFELTDKDLSKEIQKHIAEIIKFIEANTYVNKTGTVSIEDMLKIWTEFSIDVKKADGTIDDEATAKKKQSLIELNDSIESQLIKLKDLLGGGIKDANGVVSGKLDEYIQKFRKSLLTGTNYDNINDYEGSVLFDRTNKTSWSGSLSEFKRGQSIQKGTGDWNQEAYGFFVHFVLTELNAINRAGMNGSPTYSETMLAYRDFLESSRTSGITGNLKYLNTPTFEQSKALQHLVGFIMNNESVKNDKGLSIFEPDRTTVATDVFYIPSMISLLGYAGAGKTTVMPQHVIGTLLQLQSQGIYKTQGPSMKVLFVAINNELSQSHKENGELNNQLLLIGDPSVTPVVYDAITIDQLEDGSTLGYDLVFFDEGSAYTDTTWAIIKDDLAKNTDTRAITLFDQMQIPPENNTFDYAKTTGERTMPISEIFRSGIGMFHNIQAELRRVYREGGEVGVTGYYINDDTYGRVGLNWIAPSGNEQYSKTIIDNFKEEFANEQKRGLKPASIILLVHDDIQRNEIISIIGDQYASSIKTVKPGGLNQFSGLSAAKVFCAVDYDNIFSGIESRKKVQYMLTAWSRQTLYLEAVSNNTTQVAKKMEEIPGSDVAIKKVYDLLTEEQKAEQAILNNNMRDLEIQRIDKVLGGNKVAPPTGGTVVNNGPVTDFGLTPEEKENAKEIVDVIKKAIPKYKGKSKNAQRKVTTYPELTKHLTTTDKSNVNRAKGELYRALTDMFFEQQYDVATITTLATVYKQALDDYNKKNGTTDTISDPAAFAASLIRSFSEGTYTTHELISNPLTITNFSLKGRHQDGTAIVGDPIGMEIIGFDDNGHIIVNLTDIKFVGDKLEVTDYDIAKAGAYIAMAQQTAIGKKIGKSGKKITGMTVNKYTIVPIKVNMKNVNTLEELDSVVLTPEQMLKGTQDVSTIFAKEYIPVEKIQYNSNKRLVLDPDNNITAGDIYEDINTGEFVLVNHLYSHNGEIYVNYNSYSKTEDNDYLSIDEFNKQFVVEQVQGSTKVKNRGMHKSSAEMYEIEKGLHSSTAMFSNDTVDLFTPATRAMLTDKNGKPFQIYNVVGGGEVLINLPLAFRHLMMSRLTEHNNIRIVYNNNWQGYERVDGVYLKSQFDHVLTAEISLEEALSLYDEITTGMPGTKLKQDIDDYVMKMTNPDLVGLKDARTRIAYLIMNKKLNQLSVMNVPENDYRTPIDKSVIDELLTKQTYEEAIDFVNDWWNKNNAENNKFKNNPDDLYVEQLKTMNQARMTMIWEAFDAKKNKLNMLLRQSNNGKTSGVVLNTRNAIVFNDYTELKKLAREQNFTIGQFHLSPFDKDNKEFARGNKVVTVELSREGMAPVRMRVSAKVIRSGWANQLKEYKESNEAIKKAWEEFAKKKLESNEEITMHNENVRAFVDEMINGSPAFKFILANSSNPFMTSAGMSQYITYEGGKRWKLKGKSPMAKINDLIGATKILGDHISKMNVNDPNVKKFYYDMFEDYSTGKINVNNIEFHYEGLGQPELYVGYNVSGLMNRVSEPIDNYTFVEESEALAELDAIFGKPTREKFTNMNRGFINNDGIQAFGLVRDHLLTIANVNGRVEKNTPKHEAVHYVMLHMLTPKEYNSVMEDIKNRMGKAWDGQTRSLHEYAADAIKGKQIKKAKTIFEKFVQWAQRMIFNFKRFVHAYGPNLNDLIYDITNGNFVNQTDTFHNENIDLANNVVHKYNKPPALRYISKVFGSTAEAEKIMQKYIMTDLNNLGPISMVLSPTHDTFFQALPMLKDIADSYFRIGENTVTITNIVDGVEIPVTKKVNEMKATDYSIARSNIRIKSNAIAMDSYVRYQLSSNKEAKKSDFPFKIIANRLFPRLNIDVIMKEQKNNMDSDFKFVDSSKVSVQTKMAQDIKIALSSIPLRKKGGIKVYVVEQDRHNEQFVPYEQINGILSYFTLQLRQKGVTTPSIDDILGNMSDWLKNNEAMSNYSVYKYIYSFIYKFGDKYNGFITSGPKASNITKSTTEVLENGETVEKESTYRIKEVGLWYLVKNAKYLESLMSNYTDFKDDETKLNKARTDLRKKVDTLESFMRGMIAHYNSHSRTTLGKWSDGVNGMIWEAKSNKGFDMLKLGYKNTLNQVLMNGSRAMNRRKSSEITNTDDQIYKVDSTGVYYIDKTGDKTVTQKIITVKGIHDVVITPGTGNNFQVQLALEWLGLKDKVNLNVISHLIRNNSTFPAEVYATMLAAKLNAVITTNMVTDDNGSSVQFGDDKAAFEEYKSDMQQLEKLYKQLGYRLETNIRKASKGKVSNDEGGLLIPAPDDTFHLLEMLSESKMFVDGTFAVSGEYNVNNEYQQIVNPGNTFTDGIGRGSIPYIETLKRQLDIRINYVNTFNAIQEKINNGDLNISSAELNEYGYIKSNNLQYIDSPFVKIVDGKAVFSNNAILKGKITLTEFNDGDGIENEYLGVSFNEMTETDMLRVMIEGTYNLLLSGSITQQRHIPTLIDVQADKSRKITQGMSFVAKDGTSFPQYFSKRVNKGTETVLTELTYSWDAAMESIQENVNYYNEINNRSIARWNNALGEKNLKANQIQERINTIPAAELENVLAKLVINKDYTFKNGVLKPGNHLTLAFGKRENDVNMYSREMIDKFNAANTPKQKKEVYFEMISDGLNEYHALIENAGVLSSKSNVAGAISNLTTGKLGQPIILNEVLNDEMGITIPETVLTSRHELDMYEKEMRAQARKWMNDKVNKFADENPITDQSTEEEIKKFNFEYTAFEKAQDKIRRAYINTQMKELRSIRGKLAKDLLNNDLINGVYTSFHIYNEAVSQLTRGGVLSYSDIVDYGKRAAGFFAPGSVTYVSDIKEVLSKKKGIAPNTRLVIMKDIAAKNKLFTDRVDPEGNTNGLIVMNPLEHIEHKNNSGGINGPVTEGALKWVNFNYDMVKDETIYLKASFQPITAHQYRNYKYHQDAMRMMLGEQIYAEFEKNYNNASKQVAQNAENGKTIRLYTNDASFELALKQTNDYVNREGIRYKMVGYIAHESTVKNGLRNVQQYSTTDNSEITLNNISIDPNLNVDSLTNDDNISISISNETMRVQQVVVKSVVDPFKSLPTQLSALIGLGSNNSRLIDRYNNALSQIVYRAINKLKKLDSKEKILGYTKNLVIRAMITSGETGIAVDELINDRVSVEVYRKRAISALISSMSAALKPSMPGIDMTQAPALGMMHFNDRTNIPYLSENLGLMNDQEKLNGYTARPLRPTSAVLVNANNEKEKDITEKEELLSYLNDPKTSKNVKVIPGEIIAKFPYADKFGIDNDVTLMDVMELTTYNEEGKLSVTNFYETGEYRAINGAKSFEEILKGLESIFGYTIGDKNNKENREIVYAKILSSIHNNKNLRNTIRFWETKGNWKKQGKDAETEEDINNTDLILMNLAAYYKSINDAFDIFFTRIPTALGSNAGSYRYVAFDNTSANTIYTSAEKSLLDGSDYDIDSLQVYFNIQRTFASNEMDRKYLSYNDFDDETSEESTEGTADLSEEETKVNKEIKNTQKMLFNYFMEYFRDGLNLRNMLMETRTDRIAAAADELTKEEMRYANSLGTSEKQMQGNFLGREMVGHGATAEMAIVRLGHMNKADIINGINKKFIDPSITSLTSEENILLAVDSFSEEINGATDNTKLGNVLGALSINKVSSPLVSGMYVSGLEQAEVYRILKEDEDLKEIIEIGLSSYNINKFTRRNPGMKYKEKIWTLIESRITNLEGQIGDIERLDATDTSAAEIDALQVRIDKLNKYLNYAYTGEMLRSLGSISALQQGIKPTDWSWKNLMYNLNDILGMPLEIYLKNVNTIQTEGSRKFIEEYGKYVTDRDVTSKSREMYDMGWIISHNVLLRSMLNYVNTMNNLMRKGFVAYRVFEEKNSDGVYTGKNTILENTGRSQWDYEKEYLTYLNGIDQYLLGKYLKKAKGMNNVAIKEYDSDNNIIDVVYDLRTTDQVVQFMLKASEYMDILKAEYATTKTEDPDKIANFNKFIDIIVTDHDKNGYPFLRLTDSLSYTPATNSTYRMYFDKLKENEKNFFYIYQLLYYGMDRKSGSFNEIFMNPYKQGFGESINGLIRTPDVIEMAEDIIVTKKLGNKDKSKDPNIYVNVHDLKSGEDYTKKGDVFMFNNYWGSINTLGRNDVITKFKPGPKMSIADLDELKASKEVTTNGTKKKTYTDKKGKAITYIIRGSGFHGIYKEETMQDGKLRPEYLMVDGDTVQLLNGMVAKVFRIDGTHYMVSTEVTDVC